MYGPRDGVTARVMYDPLGQLLLNLLVGARRPPFPNGSAEI